MKYIYNTNIKSLSSDGVSRIWGIRPNPSIFWEGFANPSIFGTIYMEYVGLMLSKSDTRGSAMSGIAGFMSCSFMKLIYQKFSCISVLSQAELGMQLKTQLNWDQNCIFTEWNELDVKSAMFDMAEFWVSDFESIRFNLGALLVIIDTKKMFFEFLEIHIFHKNVL